MPSPLPADRTRLIGRAPEIALASTAEERLLTVVGPPGVGKSRLAAHLAHAWPERTWWIDATGLGTAPSLQAAVAAALELTAGGDVARALAGRGPAALVVDGAEHLEREAREVLGAWVDAAPELRVVVTAIGRLGVDGERVIELAPLPLEDAVALFVDRAVAAGAEPGDPRDVEALVEHLDRLPLAIELAAARATVLTPRQLLQRVQAGQRLLDGGRHGSLQAAIAFAWDLLEPRDQRALAWCSVFRGGFDVDAAEAVLDGPDVLERLAALRERSMLQRRGDRFLMLESVRAYAAVRLDASAERPAAEARHAAFYTRAGDHRAGLTSGREDPEALQWLGLERRNLLAAFERCRGDDAALLGLALNVVLVTRGPHAKAAEVLDQALGTVVDPVLRTRLLRARAAVHTRVGRPDRARVVLDEAMAALEGAPAVVKAQVLTDSSRLRGPGEGAVAREELREAIALCRGVGHVYGEAFAYNSLGVIEEQDGDHAAAGEAFEEALRRFRDAGSARMEGVATLNLGIVRSGEGRHALALDLHERARELLRASGARADEVSAHVNLGHVHLAAGRLDEAEQALRTGLAVEREVGKRDFEALALGNLGLVAAERGEWRAARTTLYEALDLIDRTGQRHLRVRCLPFLGAVEAALGHLDEARRAFAAAREALGGEPSVTLDVLEGFLDLAGAGPVEDRVRAASARLRDGTQDDVAIARRLLERAIAGISGGPAPAPAVEPAAPEEGLALGPEATWFELGGSRVDLTRRGAPRRLLLALAEQRLIAPGTGLSVDRLFQAGWPGDKALPSAASARVYTAVNTLRTLGLDRVLQRRDDGYLLDPDLPVVRAR